MNYIKQLTFLRFLAAILVVVFHFGKTTEPFDAGLLSKFISEGSIAVSFFFFLSGVVLSLKYWNNTKLNVKSFYIKRFARIYPVYVLAFVITLVLVMVFNDSYPKGGSIILQILSLHAWFSGICLEINFPSWSISVEVFFYLLFPLILAFFKRLKSKTSVILILFIWVLSFMQHYLLKEHFYVAGNPKIEQFILYFPLWHLNTFLFGMLCARYILKKKELEQNKFIISRFMFFIGCILFFVILSSDNLVRPYTHSGLMSPIFFLIVAGLSTDRSILTRFLGNKLFILLGNASYSVYIFQWPVFVAMCAILGIESLEGVHFYLYALILIAFSVFVYFFFEKRINQGIVNRFQPIGELKPPL